MQVTAQHFQKASLSHVRGSWENTHALAMKIMLASREYQGSNSQKGIRHDKDFFFKCLVIKTSIK